MNGNIKSTMVIERPNGSKDQDQEDILEEIEIVIEGTYYPFHKGYREPKGMQICPDEEEMIDEVQATLNNKPINLTELEEEKASDILIQKGKDNNEDYNEYERDEDE